MRRAKVGGEIWGWEIWRGDLDINIGGQLSVMLPTTTTGAAGSNRLVETKTVRTPATLLQQGGSWRLPDVGL